jgi:hypothetical protein
VVGAATKCTQDTGKLQRARGRARLQGVHGCTCDRCEGTHVPTGPESLLTLAMCLALLPSGLRWAPNAAARERMSVLHNLWLRQGLASAPKCDCFYSW